MNIKQRIFLILPLIIVSIITLLANEIFDYNGLFINLGTEIIGIIVTIIYVDIILQRNEKKNWENVSIKINQELCITSNVIISSLRSALGYTHNDLVYPSNLYATVKKDIEEQALEIIDGYKRNILPNFINKISKMKQKDWEIFILNLSNVHNACINHQSMYNSIASPSNIETLMNVTNLTFNISNHYHTFFDVYSKDDDKLIKETGNNERVEHKYWLHETFCKDFDKLIDILSNEISKYKN